MGGVYRVMGDRSRQMGFSKRPLALAFTQSHFGTVVIARSTHHPRVGEIKVGQAVDWQMEIRLQGEVRVNMEEIVWVTGDGQGGLWTEIWEGPRSREGWERKPKEGKRDRGRGFEGGGGQYGGSKRVKY